MTLQWPDYREFDSHTTEMLETLAAVTAMALERSPGGSAAAPPTVDTTAGAIVEVTLPGPEDELLHTPVGPLRLEVTRDGVLMPLSPDAESSREGLLSLEVTLADAACVVWDLSAPHPGIVAVLIASFSDAEIAGSLRDRLVQTKRVCARQDMSALQTLSLLNGVVIASAGPGVAVPAWLGIVDAQIGALTHCGAGESDVVLRSSSGREWTPKLCAPPLGTSGTLDCDEDVRLLLPGDRVMVRLGDAELRIARP
jgi:hypothetical protein